MPAPRPAVVDESAFVAYVQATSPHNVETVVTVRPAYQKVALDALVMGPDGLAVDPSTGEVVPGVAYRQGNPYISTRFEKDGRVAVLDALRAGRVALDMTTPAELTGGAA